MGDMYGPVLPASLKRKQQQPEAASNHKYSKRQAQPIGPALPSNISSTNNDNDDFGPTPLPPDTTRSEKDELEAKIAEIDARARGDHDAHSGRKKEPKMERPDWMIKPPEPKGGRGSTIDTSGWTESPLDKAKGKQKSNHAKTKAEEFVMSKQDQSTMEFVEKYNGKNRGKSLVDSHQFDISPDIEDVSKRPFDREKDMSMRRIDGASRQKLIDQSKGLDDRFGHGRKTFL